MADMPNEAPQVGRREDPRVRVRLGARLVTVTDTQTVSLHNLSRGGASISSDPPLKPGADVVLHWRDIEAFGSVTWVDGGRCGLRFDEPLTDDEVLLARSLSENSAAVEKAEVMSAARDFAKAALRLVTGD